MVREKKVTGRAEESADEAAVVNAEAGTTPPQEAEKPDGCAAGFYCYIGPNLTGLINHGAIFKGTRADALKAAADAIANQPLVKSLIVSGDALPVARLKVKQPGNARYANYRRVAGK